MRNRRRNMMSALAATVLMSSVSVMRTMMRPETAIEMWGVRLRAWSRPRTRGRPPSRPMAKATRLDEKMREFRAARAPRATPNTIIWRPYGMIPFAISAIALLLPGGRDGEQQRDRGDREGDHAVRPPDYRVRRGPRSPGGPELPHLLVEPCRLRHGPGRRPAARPRPAPRTQANAPHFDRGLRPHHRPHHAHAGHQHGRRERGHHVPPPVPHGELRRDRPAQDDARRETVLCDAVVPDHPDARHRDEVRDRPQPLDHRTDCLGHRARLDRDWPPCALSAREEGDCHRRDEGRGVDSADPPPPVPHPPSDRGLRSGGARRLRRHGGPGRGRGAHSSPCNRGPGGASHRRDRPILRGRGAMATREVGRHAEELGAYATARVEVSHKVFDAIIDNIREGDTDLLVLGWKGGWRKGRILGANVDRFVQEAPCDVVVFKSAGMKPKLDRILVLNAPEWHVSYATGYAILLAKKHRAKITILSAVQTDLELEKERGYSARLAEMCRTHGVPFEEKFVKIRNIVDMVVEEAKGYDLLVLGAS